eukprot:342270-Prymnesium_polylepis.1
MDPPVQPGPRASSAPPPAGRAAETAQPPLPRTTAAEAASARALVRRNGRHAPCRAVAPAAANGTARP